MSSISVQNEHLFLVDNTIASEEQWLDIKYVQDLELECPCCLNVSSSLVSLPCGHTICMNCGCKTLKLECPIDRTPVTRLQLTTECKFKTRKAQATRIRCRRSGGGCEWQGELRQQAEHEVVCPERMIKCKCGEDIVLKFLTMHQKRICTERTVVCRHCRKQILHRSFNIHTNQKCIAKPIQCPLQCDTDQDLKVSQLAEHLAHHCPLRPVVCIFCNEDVRWADVNGEQAMHDLQCIAKPQQCPQCYIQIPELVFQEHVQQECLQRLVTCPFNCTMVGLKFDGLMIHIQKECVNRIIDCGYRQSLNCTMQGTPADVALHELHDSSLHLCSAMQHLTATRTELDAYTRRDQWNEGTWIFALDPSAVWNQAQIVQRLNNDMVNIVYQSGNCASDTRTKVQTEMISLHSFRLAPWDSKPLGMQERLLKGCIRPVIHLNTD
jgi:hypothetical protein